MRSPPAFAQAMAHLKTTVLQAGLPSGRTVASCTYLLLASWRFLARAFSTTGFQGAGVRAGACTMPAAGDAATMFDILWSSYVCTQHRAKHSGVGALDSLLRSDVSCAVGPQNAGK